jgi:hypothetical protein
MLDVHSLNVNICEEGKQVSPENTKNIKRNADKTG